MTPDVTNSVKAAFEATYSQYQTQLEDTGLLRPYNATAVASTPPLPEINRYNDAPSLSEGQTPLEWWKVNIHVSIWAILLFVEADRRALAKANAQQFPVLSHMARDYLSIRGLTADVKRAFSSCRDILKTFSPKVTSRFSEFDSTVQRKSKSLCCRISIKIWLEQGILTVDDLSAGTEMEESDDTEMEEPDGTEMEESERTWMMS
jgi:hypothetical protein